MAHPRTGPGAAVAAEWPLVGRDAELEQIAFARDDATCSGVVVSAGAGVGKSRLAREAHAAAERSGAYGGWIQATSSAATVPLGACAALIPDDVRSDDTLELMRSSAEALRDRAGSRPVVLGVDDAQLLDPVSAALVLHLTTSQSAFVVATVRSGQPCPDAITSLWKDAGATRLELSELSDGAIATLVEAALGHPVEQAALQWVVDSSAGNAMYARELVLGAVEAGTLRLADGLWRMTRRPVVSPTLAELVSERLTGLTEGRRAPIELLALAEPLHLDELEDLAGAKAMLHAEAEGLITVGGLSAGGQARLAHPLYGDVVREWVGATRARRLRLDLAETLQRRDPLEPDDALRVARLLLDAGAPIPSELLLSAARAANLAGDPDLGATLAQLALDDGAGLAAALLLGRAHTTRKRFKEAEAVLAAAEATAPDDHETALFYLMTRVQVLFWGLHRPDEARALLERAAAWSTDARWGRRVEPMRLGLIATVDGHAESVDDLTAILADGDLDDVTRRRTQRRLAVSLFFTGRMREAAELARPLLPNVPLRGYDDALVLGLWRLLGLESGKDWPGLEAFMRAVLIDGVQAGDDEAAGQGAFALGYVAFMDGRIRDAARWFAEADLHFERNDTFGTLLQVRAMQVGVAAALGDLDALDDAEARLLAALGGRTPRSSQKPYVARARGWAVRARHPPAAGAVFLDEAAALDAMPAYAAQLVHEALRAGATPRTAADRLAALQPRTDAPLVALYAAHATAAAAGDGAALLECSADLAALGARRYALEAALDAAMAFLAVGRRDSARRAAARARHLHAPEQGLDVPVVDGLDESEVALTRRERQLVDLAAQGLSNADIADRLVVSVRTVESHLYRAMHKLGVGDRRDL